MNNVLYTRTVLGIDKYEREEFGHVSICVTEENNGFLVFLLEVDQQKKVLKWCPIREEALEYAIHNFMSIRDNHIKEIKERIK